MNTPPAAASLRFGRFELQPRERRLLVAGEPAALGARALDLLQVLAERADQLVSKNALMELVWPDVVVEENNLAAQISALRKVLGGDVIATVPGRGYRFTARIESAAHGESGVHRARADADRDAATERRAASSATSSPPTNLPAELTPLLGRADDVTALGALIDQHRLVSIVGAGGMGKTLLAQHLLDARRGTYPHGVCWVELAPVTDPAALPGAIAAALGVNGGQGEPLSALISAVAPLTLLLALDNAEHLVADVAHVCETLRRAAPGLHLVVTSQAPLRLAAERVYRIGSLAVPREPLPAVEALEFGAVALFTERAQAADSRFALTDASAALVIELCRALDGVALAIELAAARAPVLGVQRLAASMRDRLNLLTSSPNRYAPERQQTLRAALEWSHAMLGEREQKVFRRLAVAAGSASLELIQQVVADPPGEGALDDWDVLDALEVLVDRSLVAVLNTETDQVPPRYRLLDSPRIFALERLAAAGEHEALRRRHALAMAALFDTAWDEYFSGRIGHDEWMRKQSFDRDNAREALVWAEAAGEAAIGLSIGSTLARALPLSLYAERKALADLCEALAGPAAPEFLQQRAWFMISTLHGNAQRPRSRAAAHRALELARFLHGKERDPYMLYLTLSLVASAEAAMGHAESAEAALVEMRALEQPDWSPQRLYFGVDTSGYVAGRHGNAADALRYTRRAVALDLARGARLSGSLINLIDYELAAGEAAAAVRSGTELVAALEGTRNEYDLTHARLNLVAALLALGKCERARQIAQAGWPQAALFEMNAYWADYLALLAALDSRPEAAAKLSGYADAGYAVLHDTRQSNEDVAAGRARTLARAALGETEFQRLHAEGVELRDTDIAHLAFGSA